MRTFKIACVAVVVLAQCSLPLLGAELPELAAIKAVGPKGEGHAAAVTAAKKLQEADPKHLLEVLAAIDGASPLAQNWLRGAAEAMAQRQLKTGKLPIDQLEAFLKDAKHSPRGRRLAYELIAKVDDSAESRLVPGFLNDPSLELRRDAVALALKEAEKAKDDPAAAKAKYKVAYDAARDQDQVKEAATKLKELGETVSLPEHYGYIMTWHLMAPFDNVGDKGFDVAYPPEKEVDLTKTYEGKEAKIGWAPFTTKDELGLVDLNTALDKYKGAICYATATFISDKDQTVDLRMNCVTAFKAWVNGEPVGLGKAYHQTTGEDLDQFVWKASLKKGKNTILLKICQNEQTEGWAQRWQFSARICDVVGTPIFSQDRTLGKTAGK
jgi:hypothetical protein